MRANSRMACSDFDGSWWPAARLHGPVPRTIHCSQRSSLGLRFPQQSILAVLVVSKRLPEANDVDLAPGRGHHDAKRIEFRRAGERAKQRHFRRNRPSPLTPLRPVQHDRPLPPPGKPGLLDISLPVRTVRVDEQQVSALASPGRAEAVERAPFAPTIVAERPEREQRKSAHHHEKSAPEEHSAGDDSQGNDDSREPADHASYRGDRLTLTDPLALLARTET